MTISEITSFRPETPIAQNKWSKQELDRMVPEITPGKSFRFVFDATTAESKVVEARVIEIIEPNSNNPLIRIDKPPILLFTQKIKEYKEISQDDTNISK